MATLVVVQKPKAKKIKVEINLNQWEQLADIFGFYRQSFLNTLNRSMKESERGRVKKIRSLKELD